MAERPGYERVEGGWIRTSDTAMREMADEIKARIHESAQNPDDDAIIEDNVPEPEPEDEPKPRRRRRKAEAETEADEATEDEDE